MPPKPQSRRSTRAQACGAPESNVSTAPTAPIEQFLRQFLQYNHERRSIQPKDMATFVQIMSCVACELQVEMARPEFSRDSGQNFMAMLRIVQCNFDELSRSVSNQYLYYCLVCDFLRKVLMNGFTQNNVKWQCEMWARLCSDSKQEVEDLHGVLQDKIKSVASLKSMKTTEILKLERPIKQNTSSGFEKVQTYCYSILQGPGMSVEVFHQAVIATDDQIMPHLAKLVVHLAARNEEKWAVPPQLSKLVRVFASLGESTRQKKSNVIYLLSQAKHAHSKIFRLLLTEMALPQLFSSNEMTAMALEELCTFFNQSHTLQSAVRLLLNILPLRRVFKSFDGQISKKLDQTLVRLPNSVLLFVSRVYSEQFCSKLKLQDSKKFPSVKDSQVAQVPMLCTLLASLLAALLSSDKLGLSLRRCYGSQKQWACLMGALAQLPPKCDKDLYQLLLQCYYPLVRGLPYLSQAQLTGKSTSEMLLKILSLDQMLMQGSPQDQQLIAQYYWPVLHSFTAEEKLPNYYFIVLAILNEHLQEPENAVKSILQAVENGSQPWVFRNAIAIIAHLLEINEVIDCSMEVLPRVKKDPGLAGEEYRLSSYLASTAIKQTRIFRHKSIMRASLPEHQKLLDEVGKFMNRFVEHFEADPASYRPDTEAEANCFYFVVIQILNVCEEQTGTFNKCSSIKQAVLQLRANNSVSMLLPLFSRCLDYARTGILGRSNPEVVYLEKQVPKHEPSGHQTALSEEAMIVMLHSLMKIQAIAGKPLQEPDSDVISISEMGEGRQPQRQAKPTPELQKQLQLELVVCLKQVIRALTTNPCISTLVVVGQLDRSGNQVESLERQLESCVKKNEMVNFLLKAAANQYILLVVLIRRSLAVLSLFTDSHELAEAEALYFTKMGEQSRIAESLSLRLIVEHLKGTVSIPYINKLTSLIECRPAILAQAIGPSAYSQLLNYHDPDELIHALTRSLTNLTPVRPEIISMVARLVADSPQIAQRVSSELSSLLLGDQAQLVLISKHDLKIAYLHQYYQLALKLIEAHDNPQLKTEICSKVVEITDKAQKQHRCCLQVLECLLAATNPGQQRLRAKIRAGLEGFTQSLCATEVQQQMQMHTQILNLRLITAMVQFWRKVEPSQEVLQRTALIDYVSRLNNRYREHKVFNLDFLLGSTEKPSPDSLSDFGLHLCFFLWKIVGIQDEGPRTIEQQSPSVMEEVLAGMLGAGLELGQTCLGSKSKIYYRCLDCKFLSQLCRNCAARCHTGHSLVFVPKSYVIFKQCQCFEQNCSLNSHKVSTKHESKLEFSDFARENRLQAGYDPTEELEYLTRKSMLLKEHLRQKMENRPVNRYISFFKMSEGMEEEQFSSPEPYERFLTTNRLLNQLEGRRALGRPSSSDPSLDTKIQAYLRKDAEYESISNEDDNRSHQSQPGQHLDKQNEENLGHVAKQKEQNVVQYREPSYQEIWSTVRGHCHQRQQRHSSKRSKILKSASEIAALMPIVGENTMRMLREEQDSVKSQGEEQRWEIKFDPLIELNNNMINLAQQLHKLVNTGIQTQLTKHETQVAPCVAKAPFALDSLYLYVVSGNQLNIYSRETLYSAMTNSFKVHRSPACHSIPLVLEAHSIGVWEPKNVIVVCGLRNVVLFQNDFNVPVNEMEDMFRIDQLGFPRALTKYKHNVSYQFINKMKVTKFGVFIGLGREIRLLSFELAVLVTFRMPEGWIKQWCVYTDEPSSPKFKLYVTTSDGIVYVSEGNFESSGEVGFMHKINDQRPNRPVGSFVTVKKLKGCGTVMLSSFKDKKVGHSFGNLVENNLRNVSYLKLNGHGIQSLDKNCIIGLADIVNSYSFKDPSFEVPEKHPLRMHIVATFKQELNDTLAIHRGLLGFVRLTQKGDFVRLEDEDPTEESLYNKPMVQLLDLEKRCEYFEIVVMEKTRQWFVLSLHEDGNLLITMPVKVSSQSLQAELQFVRQLYKNKKSAENRKPGSEQQQVPDKNSTQASKFELYRKEKQVELLKQRLFQIKIEDVKRSLAKEPCPQCIQFLQDSEQLKYKQQYQIEQIMGAQLNGGKRMKKLRVKLLNSNKMPTGMLFPYRLDAVLPTKELKNVLQVGFNLEESLYYYSQGWIEVCVSERIRDSVERDSSKPAMLTELKRRKAILGTEQKAVVEKYLNKQKMQELGLYAEELNRQYIKKVIAKEQPYAKFFSHMDPACLSRIQKIEVLLQTCQTFLMACLSSQFADVDYDFKGLAEFIKLKVQNKNDISGELYPLVKSIIVCALRMHGRRIGREATHVFNDELHPLRNATESKIAELYDQMVKSDIETGNLCLLVSELYSLGDELGPYFDLQLLGYYLAKYPLIPSKLSKKLKILEQRGLLHLLLPIYLLGYVVLDFLNYECDWILSTLAEIVGKKVPCLADPTKLVPSPQARVQLYKALKLAQQYTPEAWLRSIDSRDKQQVLRHKKQDIMLNFLPVENEDDLEEGLSQFEEIEGEQMLDEEVRMIIQQQREELRQMKLVQRRSRAPSLPKQAEHLMQSQGDKRVMIRLVDECLRSINYLSTNEDFSYGRVITTYVLIELMNEKRQQGQYQVIIVYLLARVQSTVEQLCTGYVQLMPGPTHNIILLWLYSFGHLFSRLGSQSEPVRATYLKCESSVKQVLGRFKPKLSSIAKIERIPNLILCMFNGDKVPPQVSLVHGFISILQYPCQPHYVLLALECYWLFPHPRDHYRQLMFRECILEGYSSGSVRKIYDQAVTDVAIWKEVGDPEWLESWVAQQKDDWPLALELLALYYQ